MKPFFTTVAVLGAVAITTLACFSALSTTQAKATRLVEPGKVYIAALGEPGTQLSSELGFRVKEVLDECWVRVDGPVIINPRMNINRTDFRLQLLNLCSVSRLGEVPAELIKPADNQ